MSDAYLRLIPTNPSWVSEDGDYSSAREILAALIPEHPYRPVRVDIEISEHVSFVDQGGSFESVHCPGCGEELDIAWWQAAMDTAWDTRFEDLSVTTSCCHAETNLNDLGYQPAAGFARVCLEVQNPERGLLTGGELQQVARAMGTELRQVQARY